MNSRKRGHTRQAKNRIAVKIIIKLVCIFKYPPQLWRAIGNEFAYPMSIRDLIHARNEIPSASLGQSVGNDANMMDVALPTRTATPVSSGPNNNQARGNDTVFLDNQRDEMHMKLVDSMLAKVSETLHLDAEEKKLLDQFVLLSNQVDKILSGRGDMHCIIRMVDCRNSPSKNAIAPLFSSVFLPALDRRSIASDSASHALADAFSVAKRAIDIGWRKAMFPTQIDVPVWISNPREEENPSGLRNITINNNLLVAIERLSISELISIYGEFFHYLWNICKTARGWRSGIVYGKLTPPWLRGDVVFLHGPNQSNSIPFIHGELPRKGLLKDKSQKIVGSAILALWLEKETSTAPALRWYFDRKGFHLD